VFADSTAPTSQSVGFNYARAPNDESFWNEFAGNVRIALQNPDRPGLYLS
jgi:hypothetical protein